VLPLATLFTVQLLSMPIDQFTKQLFVVLLLSSVFIFSFSIPAAANDPMTKKQFAQEALKYVRKSHPDSSYELKNDLSIASTKPDGSSGFTFYLDNAYAIYLNEPNKIEDVLSKFLAPYDVNRFDQSDLEKKLASIMPVLKSNNYINGVKAMMQQKDPDAKFPFFYESQNNGLNLLYAFDTEQSMQFLSNQSIDELGVTDEQLKSRALENLMLAIPELRISGDTSFVSYLIADENYESSLLLIDQLWTKETFPVKGDIIVFALNRATVLITGSKDQKGIEAITNIVNVPDSQVSHALATTFHIRKDNKWEVFIPPN
jgi:uncharacterized protein YtpQ (UPF0354 family)